MTRLALILTFSFTSFVSFGAQPEWDAKTIDQRLLNLKLDVTTLSGKRVLSLNEGDSGFVPFLVSKGVDAFAIEKSELYQKQLTGYIQAHSDRLQFGDPKNISSHVLAAKKFDLIVSDNLIEGNESEADYIELAKDLAANLTTKGEIRIFLSTNAIRPKGELNHELINAIKTLNAERADKKHTFEIKVIPTYGKVDEKSAVKPQFAGALIYAVQEK